MADEPMTIPTSSSNSKENETPSTPPQSIQDGAPALDPVTGGTAPATAPAKKHKAAADPVVDQGKAAKALELDSDACPYADGDNRDKWFKGFGGADPEAEAE